MVAIRLVPLPNVELVHHLHWRQVAVLLDVQHAEQKLDLPGKSWNILSRIVWIFQTEIRFLRQKRLFPMHNLDF